MSALQKINSNDTDTPHQKFDDDEHTWEFDANLKYQWIESTYLE